MLSDLTLAELREYHPPRDEPADFDEFWGQTLSEARRHETPAAFVDTPTLLQTVQTFDVTFPGFAGQPIRAWLNLPRVRSGPLPCVIEYFGYGGGRGEPHESLLFSAAGYAHLVVDSRGQGGSWRSADTPDLNPGVAPHEPGFTTMGIDSPRDYYYRRLYTDAVRAVDAARACEYIDDGKIAVTGGSQGGALALAVGGLVPGLQAVMPSVPFMCHIRRAVAITDKLPYFEITRYLRTNPRAADTAMRTLSYFDGTNFAARASAPGLFSVGLMDTVCPPSTVFAAYHHYQGTKDIRVWEFAEHDGAGPQQAVEQLRYLRDVAGFTGSWGMNAVVKSADRTLAILDLLAENPGGLTLAEIHTRLDFPKSSTFVLLMTMVNRGFLEQNPDNRRFQTGIRLWQAGQSYVAAVDLEKAALPFMEALRDELNETVQLATLDGTDNVYIAKVDPNQQLRLASRVGVRLPAYATALGKSLLSQLDDGEIEARFAEVEFVKFTPQTIGSLRELIGAVRTVRTAGYATDDSEYTPGVSCVAAPIPRRPSGALAAVSVSIPGIRKTPAVLKVTIKSVRATAAQISQRMGYDGAATAAKR